VQLAGQGTLIFVPDCAMLRLFVDGCSDGVRLRCLLLLLLTFGVVALAVAGAFAAFAAVTLALTALSLVCFARAVCCAESFAATRWCVGRQGRVLVRQILNEGLVRSCSDVCI
jgi:hypothetical protein